MAQGVRLWAGLVAASGCVTEGMAYIKISELTLSLMGKRGAGQVKSNAANLLLLYGG